MNSNNKGMIHTQNSFDAHIRASERKASIINTAKKISFNHDEFHASSSILEVLFYGKFRAPILL